MSISGFTVTDFLNALSALGIGEPFGLWMRLNHPNAGVTGQIFVSGQDGQSDNRRHVLMLSAETIQAASFDTGGSAANAGTVPGNAWAAAQAAWISSVLRSMWIEGAGRVDDTESRTPAAPDSVWVGITTTLSNPFPGALAEMAVWDLTGFSTADENDWAALGATAINPYLANRQNGAQWEGALVAYWRFRTPLDIQDLSGNGHDLQETGSLTTFASHPPSDQIILAAFNGGEGSSQIDQLPGVAGGGWVGDWHVASGANADHAVNVVNTNPIDGGGNYLEASNTALGVTATGAKVGREYEDLGNIDITQLHQLELKIRFDTLPADWNQISLFCRETLESNVGGTSGEDSWEIASFGGPNFLIRDGAGFVDSGVVIQTGVVYTMLLTLRAADYSVRIAEDGVVSFASGSLDYRNGSTTGPSGFLQISTNNTEPPNEIAYSLDAILIAESLSELTSAPTIGAGEAVSPNHVRLTGLVESAGVVDEYEVWAAISNEHPSAFDGEVIATLPSLAATEVIAGLSADNEYRIGIKAISGVSESFSNEVMIETLEIAHFTLTDNDTISIALDTSDDDSGVLESLNGVDVQFGKYEDDGPGTVNIQVQLENDGVIIYDETFNDVGLLPINITDQFEDVSPVVNPCMHITAFVV